MVKSILFVGVGGQGTLLASKITGKALIKSGSQVKVSEVHGMSQRGGSVITYVRYGDEVCSPIVPDGEADIIVAFEELEALRWAYQLKQDGHLIVNKQKMMPMPVITGTAKYPSEEELAAGFASYDVEPLYTDATLVAAKCGIARAANVVMIGFMASKMELDKEIWLEAVKECVPEKFLEPNIKAFEAGYALGL